MQYVPRPRKNSEATDLVRSGRRPRGRRQASTAQSLASEGDDVWIGPLPASHLALAFTGRTDDRHWMATTASSSSTINASVLMDTRFMMRFSIPYRVTSE